MEGGKKSAGHSHQSLSASSSHGDSGGRCWRGQRCFIGLNLNLIQAQHIVSDRLFTHRLLGHTDTHTCTYTLFIPFSCLSSPKHGHCLSSGTCQWEKCIFLRGMQWDFLLENCKFYNKIFRANNSLSCKKSNNISIVVKLINFDIVLMSARVTFVSTDHK